MKKKFSVLAIFMSTLFVLTGCSSSVPDLSDVDNDIAAQYMADALLQHDKKYDDSLEYDHSILEATPTPAPTPVPATPAPDTDTDTATAANAGSSGDAAAGTGASTTQNASQSGQDGTDVQQNLNSVSLSELLGVDGVAVKGNSYSIKSSYGTEYSVCTPKKGKKLLVAHFTIANTTKTPKKINLEKQNLQINLLVNGTNAGEPLKTIIEGDMQYLNTKLPAGKKKQGALIFEVDKGVKASSVEVQFVKENNQATVGMH